MAQEKKKIPWKELGKSRILLLLAALLGLLLLAWPTGQEENASGTLSGSQSGALAGDGASGSEEEVPAAASPKEDYTDDLETRLKKLLVSMDGVGQVEVMITLKSTGEKILQIDSETSGRGTEERDSSGGSRLSEDYETSQSTVLVGENAPFVVREIMPEVEGVVVLCDGGSNAKVKNEIVDAVGALFDVPAHKIKVLKRVSGKS